MRIEARIFLGVSGFLFGATVLYALWTAGDSATGHVEVAGTTALALSGGLALIIGSYFAFVARRIDPRPEDRPDADVAEGAGELGFFSPGSYWPIGIALSAALAGFGLAFFQVWLLIIALASVLATVGGLLFEYYTRGHASPLA
jgi:hypothetical protein